MYTCTPAPALNEKHEDHILDKLPDIRYFRLSQLFSHLMSRDDEYLSYHLIIIIQDNPRPDGLVSYLSQLFSFLTGRDDDYVTLHHRWLCHRDDDYVTLHQSSSDPRHSEHTCTAGAGATLSRTVTLYIVNLYKLSHNNNQICHNTAITQCGGRTSVLQNIITRRLVEKN